MAFSLYASTGSTTTQLNDGNPFWLERAEGMSGAPVNRHAQRGPAQDGVTDLGYRLRPREVTLHLLFYAATDTLLDTYRQTLTDVFNPLPSISTFLTVVRDDSELRKLVCHVVDEIEIDLVPEERVAHLHRAVVKLRAADPLYYANTVTSAIYNYATADEWWYAGGTIAGTQILAITEYPYRQQSAYPYNGVNGTVNVGTPWAVAVVTAKGTANGSGLDQYVWKDGGGGSAGFFYDYGTGKYMFNNNTGGGLGYNWPGSVEENYHVIANDTNSVWWFGSAGTIVAHVENGAGHSLRMPAYGQGITFYWRGNQDQSTWTPDVRKGLVFKAGNSTQLRSQLVALRTYMLNNPLGTTNTLGTITLVNDGDVPAYPLFTLYGPMTNPVITNQTTGEIIDLTGASLTGSAAYILDLRNGNKSLVDSDGNSAMGSVTTTPASLASFAIAPAPTASGGTNVITLTVDSVGTAAYFQAEITNRYTSF